MDIAISRRIPSSPTAPSQEPIAHSDLPQLRPHISPNSKVVISRLRQNRSETLTLRSSSTTEPEEQYPPPTSPIHPKPLGNRWIRIRGIDVNTRVPSHAVWDIMAMTFQPLQLSKLAHRGESVTTTFDSTLPLERWIMVSVHCETYVCAGIWHDCVWLGWMRVRMFLKAFWGRLMVSSSRFQQFLLLIAMCI